VKSTTSGTTTITYSYDGDGTRQQEQSGSTVTKFLWDVNNPLPELALERNGSNALLRRYLYGSDLHSMETSATARFYYHQDGLGSVTNMTNSSGAKQWTYVWEPFGTKRTETKNAGSAPANMMRFAGEYMDTATSLYHLRARQYDPAIGRFLATDPITQPLSDPYLSSYVYADNRPTVLVDPSGLDGESVNCPWPSKIPFVGKAYCEGFRSLSPGWQGIAGATAVAGPQVLPIGGGAAIGIRIASRGRHVDDVARSIREFVGKDAKLIKNKHDDLILVSRDGTRQVGIDVSRTHPHKSPHAHVEERVGGVWKKSGPIFPRDVHPG
jgi:RHS repeat-associated protein